MPENSGLAMALKILQVIPAIAPRYGGPSQLVLAMSRALTSEGHDVNVVTSNADGMQELDQPLGQWVDYAEVQTLFFARAYGEGFKFAKGMWRWLKRHVGKYDVVHIHGVFSWSSLVAGRACRLAGVPYIVRPLGSLDPWSMAQKPLRKKILWRAGVKALLQRAGNIHYTTELEKHFAESGLKLGNGVVIANALTLDQYTEDLTDTTFAERFCALKEGGYILFLGRLHPKKKLEALIEQFARMADHHSVKLVIAGSGAEGYARSLAERAANSAVKERIVFVNWVDGAAKTALLKRCALLVLNSENENYGISVVEAMACGRPVVVNQGVYLYREIKNADAGWVIERDDELAGVLGSALMDRDALARKGNNAKTLVMENFTWETVVIQLIDLYRGLAKGDTEG